MVILCVIPFNENQKQRVTLAAPDAEWIFSSGAAYKEEDLARADILLGNLPPAALKKASSLKWMQLNSAGVDAYCKEGVLPEGVILTNAKGAYGPSVSDWMLTATYMLLRRMDQYMVNQTRHVWREEGNVDTLENATVLLLGLGDIGSDYARKVHALGANVIALTRTVHGELPDYVAENHTIDELDRYLPGADIVAMVLPGTKETYHLMDARRLALMKKSAYLVNAGRGDSVDNLALDEALREGVLAGAALDVTEPEPLPADHPLWDCPRAIIAPHIAGKFFLAETLNRISGIAAENLAHFLAGDGKMINVIDLRKGY